MINVLAKTLFQSQKRQRFVAFERCLLKWCE
jgi:hypothetical protein